MEAANWAASVFFGGRVAGTVLKLIVGLGNPGEKYARTRHNVGFWFADELVRRYGGVFRTQSYHQGEVARVRVTHEGSAQAEIFVLKPTTYVNKSGGAIATLVNFYDITPAEVLVAHDELDLPVGVARLKLSGGHGGHNGLRDTMKSVGADFWRMRLGIGHPCHKHLVHDYVLQRSPADQERAIYTAVIDAVDVLPLLLSQGAEKAMNRLHSKD
ncbi:MAG: aminoacyl-tRNA hydrolase [Gammaproteobacteria bacterium]|nr:aminoacyl-tRNA hydrolase [Gammaproteobacteria bacterium]